MSKEKENITCTEDFSHHLMNTVPIVWAILKHLNARQLNSCSRVCHLWNNIVQRLRSKRCTRSWTCLQLPVGAEDITPIQEGTKEFLQNLYTEPDVVYMICESGLLSTNVAAPTQTRSGRRSHLTSQNYQDYVRSLLPKSCKLVGVGAGGIVGTSVDCKKSYEIENDVVGVAFLCLPRYEGVSISLCEDVEEEEYDLRIKIQQFYESLLEPEKPPCKLILMLLSDFHAPREYGSRMMEAVTGTLVAGAYVDEISPLNQGKYTVIRLASISGDSIQVASVIINESIDNASDAEECVKKLKGYNLPEENSFAFMFACLGRGEGLYGEPNVESSLFRKYFPRTPLIGLFGNGEIGFELVNKGNTESEGPEVKKKKSPVTLYHSYTTVLVLVSVT